MYTLVAAYCPYLTGQSHIFIAYRPCAVWDLDGIMRMYLAAYLRLSIQLCLEDGQIESIFCQVRMRCVQGGLCSAAERCRC